MEEQKPKYPTALVHVDLNGGPGGYSFAVLADCRSALADAGVSREEQGNFFKEATKGSYTDLLSVILKWLTVTNKDEVWEFIEDRELPTEPEMPADLPEPPDDIPDIEDMELVEEPEEEPADYEWPTSDEANEDESEEDDDGEEDLF